MKSNCEIVLQHIKKLALNICLAYGSDIWRFSLLIKRNTSGKVTSPIITFKDAIDIFLDAVQLLDNLVTHI